MAEEVVVTIPEVQLPLPGFHRDAFNPVLFNEVSPYAGTTIEQDDLINQVLALASSDSRFAQKALAAIKLILAGGIVGAVPVLNTLEPATSPNNNANLKIKCKGASFDATCVIYMNGNPMPTTFVSPTEITTNVNLVGMAPQTINVAVVSGAGVVSQTRTFTVTAAPPPPPEEDEGNEG
jgi:hypothetical protein